MLQRSDVIIIWLYVHISVNTHASHTCNQYERVGDAKWYQFDWLASSIFKVRNKESINLTVREQRQRIRKEVGAFFIRGTIILDSEE